MEEHIKPKKKNAFNLSSIITIVLLVIVVFQLNTLNGKLDGTEGTVQVPTLPTPIPTAAAPVDVDADDDAFKGDADAPVTIIEFSDYECPFCGRFYSQTLPEIQEKYIDTGKVRLVYRDFPLGFHAQAQKAAEAAECAGEQDKYFDMHDLLFESGLGDSKYSDYAEDIGLDVDAFEECLDSDAMASEVQSDFSAGQAAGVTGTPAFFVNGQKLVGAQPFSVFEAAIEAALAE